MNPECKCILVIAHDVLLRETRTLLLQKTGYKVISVGIDADMVDLPGIGQFDLILIGHQSFLVEGKDIDQRLRERYPDILILKIENDREARSVYPSRITDPLPSSVLAAIRDMLITDASKG